MLFQDRVEAGRLLARRLASREWKEPIVLGVPRGGVVVAHEIAHELEAPLDVIVPRKLGAPGEPELAIGAVASWGEDEVLIDELSVRYLGVTDDYIRREAKEQRAEIERRLLAYRGTTEPPAVAGRDVILVDDGVATGSTLTAAVRSLKRLGPRRITIAVPVASPEAISRLRSEVEDIVVLDTPSPFMAVGYWYRSFEQTTDEEVQALLQG